VEKESRHDDESVPDFQGAPIPTGEPGGALTIGQPTAVPERTPANFICLRGPCRHYWYLVTMAQEGNPEETWAHLGIPAPRQHHHTCLVNGGYETSFGDDNAYECSKWEPLLGLELTKIRNRRESYYEDHPEHRPGEKNDTD
jgi:hypothetical protein